MIWDDRLKGFGVKVSRTVKSYIVNYRVDGRERRATIGRVGEVSLKEARIRAAELTDSLRYSGRDPLVERQMRREAPTFEDAVNRFFGDYTPERIRQGRMALRTEREYRLQAKSYLLPKLGRKKVADIERHDVEQAVAALRPVARNRTLAFASRLFNLVERWEWRPLHSNPTIHIDRSREEPRDRTLSPSEMASLGRALTNAEARHPATVGALRAAALSGLRINEVLAMRWEDIDTERGILTVPASKTGRRLHDLPPELLDVIQTQPRVCEWIFSNTGRAHVTYRTAREVFAGCARDAGIENLRIHDLRRTYLTRAAMSGIGVHTLRDMLGHRSAAQADKYIRRLSAPVRSGRFEMATTLNGELSGQYSQVGSPA